MLGSLVLCIFPIAFTFASDPSSRVKLHNTAHYNALFMGWSKENRIEFKDDLDYQVRLEVFSRNNDFIEEHNTAASFGEHSYTLAHNEFSHLSWEEFKKHYLGVLPKSEVSSKRAKGVSNDDAVQDLPGSVDWVERGAVTSVKNQGMCGSCWAFSAIGALEGALAIATGNLIDLSEEQLLDCDKVDQGCDGGEMYSAFDWMKEAGGVCAAEDYPYTGILPPFKKCRMDCKPVDGTQVSGWIRANANEKSVMAAVSERPLAVSIEADQMAFQFYRDGVFNAACGTDLDHGVILVGYGTSEEGQEYWKVKNSWGSSWGKEGYILLARNDNQGDSEGECGILMDATYPILAQESGLIAIESEVSTPLPVTPIKASIPLSFEEARGRYRSIERAINDMLNSLYDTIFFLPTPIFSSSESSAASSMVMLGSIKEWNALFEEDESEYLGHNSADVVDCGGGAAVFEQIDVVPSVPSRGKPISLKAYGVLTKPIESGTYKLSVQMGGTVVYEHQGSICGKSEAGLPLGLGKIVMVGFDCPSNPGPVNYSMDVELPIISPPGHYTISLTGVDQDQIALVCLKANLSL